ncbi:MAG TPA: cytidylate kinase-like family protein [Dehalococcoidia bacterium]|nr:cytidylate kinase-like family protein [Dehalococcoidia bacterium]
MTLSPGRQPSHLDSNGGAGRPSVITIAAQSGSGGQAIAQLVALRLGYSYFDWEITSRAALQAGVSADTMASAERWPSLLERLLQNLMLGGEVLSQIYVLPDDAQSIPSLLRAYDYRLFLENVVWQLAERGRCVIVGHAAQCILRQRWDRILKVLVFGSAEARAERIASQEGIDMADAMARIRDSDKQRVDYFRHVHKVDWLAPQLYHMALRSDGLSDADAADLVLQRAGYLG